jgi:hypothetical protein
VPEIGRIGKVRILMFFHDENPPHVHVAGPGFAAKLRIANGDVIAGEAPSKALRDVRRWIAERQAELSALWSKFQE